MRTVTKTLAGLCLFCSSSLLNVFATPAKTPPNVLIIVVDDQGYADLSAYEHSAPDVSTPNMDRLAERGGAYTKADGDWGAHVVTDGLVVTGQNPASAEGTAQALAALLA